MLQDVKIEVDKVGQQLAMHAAGMRPLFLNQASVPEELLDHERNTLRQMVSMLLCIHLYACFAPCVCVFVLRLSIFA